MQNTFIILKRVLATILFIAIAALCVEMVRQSQIQQVVKYDNANLNHMRYGMFNVNQWKQRMTEIVVGEIEDFKITNANKAMMKSHIEDQLGALIDKVEAQIKESNKGSTKGWLKQKFLETFVDVNDIKKGIPSYAESITEQISKEKSQAQFKEVIKSRLQAYLDETFEVDDPKEIKDILQRHGAANEEQAQVIINQKLQERGQELFHITWLTILLSALLFALFFWSGRPNAYEFFLLLSTLLVLLFVGVICPMIDMNARIEKFGFVLLGRAVEFHNQIVYFQSKSILDVFWILIKDPAMQMKVVGVLMVMFSIVFPLIKMISSVFYFYEVGGQKTRKVLDFFVIKSGKWSMTDVQIVAIMMAYIGFNGMVTTQFQTLKEYVSQVDMISTNDTTLQIGFFVFLTYAVLAMVFSSMIAKGSKKKQGKDFELAIEG